MKYTLVLALGLATLFSSAQAWAEDKVLISGDSWGFFLCINGSFKSVFDQYQFKKMKVYPTCAVTSRVGLRAENWQGSTFDKITSQLLRFDKSIKVLFLSLGGNDMINHWNKNLHPDQEKEVFQKIHQDLSKIIARYQALRPDLKIIVSGYDYPRFTPHHPVSAYQKAYEDMGQPMPAEINGGVYRFSAWVSQLGRQSNVYYIHHLGVTQYHFGNAEDGIAPGQTLNPDFISTSASPVTAGGAMSSYSPAQGMLSIGPVVDAFHLSKSGYKYLAEHVFRNYLQKW